MTDKIVSFYDGGKDHAGRTLEQILGWNDDRLEHQHDYIQWVFPNRNPSNYNDKAPLVTNATADVFRFRADLRERLSGAADRMDRFYRDSVWVTPGNHNFLRITRILLALTDLGLPHRARAFYEARTEEFRRRGTLPGRDPVPFWDGALRIP